MKREISRDKLLAIGSFNHLLARLASWREKRYLEMDLSLTRFFALFELAENFRKEFFVFQTDGKENGL